MRPLHKKMRTLEELTKDIENYIDHGYKAVVEAGVRHAQIMTRAHIERTHASTGFGGKNLLIDEKATASKGKTIHQIQKGKFKINALTADAVIYANYFARWYNTGATQHEILYGPYKTRQSTHYPPRGEYFESNRAAIEDYFCGQLEMYMATHIKIGR